MLRCSTLYYAALYLPVIRCTTLRRNTLCYAALYVSEGGDRYYYTCVDIDTECRYRV